MKNHLIYLLIIVFTGCSQTPEVDLVKISGSEKYISIPTEGLISPKSHYIHYFEIEDRSWLFYGNGGQRELIIYQLPSGEIYKRVKFDSKGPDGIGAYRGVLAHNFDTIFLVSATYYNNFFLTDTTGKVRQKFAPEPSGKANTPPAIRSLSSHLGSPGVFHNGKINLGTYLFRHVENEDLHEEIIDFTYDIEKKKTTGFANYPRFDGKFKARLAGWSRTFDGKHFIYSFQRKDSVHIQNNDGTYTEFYAGSKYRTSSLDWKVNRRDLIIEQRKLGVENPHYISILYDKNNKTYYRFFLPGYNLNKDENIIKHSDYPELFSIIILDENLKLIGETLLPAKTYDPYMKFVGKDGLYLALHIDHPLYNPDKLAFERMKIVKN